MSKKLRFRSGLYDDICPPDKPSRCTWTRTTEKESSPHETSDWRRPPLKLLPNALAAIGNTPLIKLNQITKEEGLKCDIYVKCEYFNPGGSVKDRVALRLVEDAEKQGLLKPGSTIIEPSSGNTGIGLSLVAAVKGYKCIIVLTEKISHEKEYVLRALGAEVIRTPSTADSYAPDGIFGVTYRLGKEIPNSVILDQFSNPENPLTHYDTTAEEIYDQCDGQVDMVVVGAGTGGTVTGIGRKFKEKSPETQIVSADPYGSVYAYPPELNEIDVKFWEVEGIGYDFVPTLVDRSVVDKWVKINDKEGFVMARRMIREGLLVGASAGTIVAAAVKAAKDLKAGQKVVVLLPDGIRNYLTKFVCDQWMEQRGFSPVINTQNYKWWDTNVCSLTLSPIHTATLEDTAKNILDSMKKWGIDQIPILNKSGDIAGVITMHSLINMVLSGSQKMDATIENCMDRLYPKVYKSANLGLVSRILEKETYVVILDAQDAASATTDKPFGIVTAVDLLNFIKEK